MPPAESLIAREVDSAFAWIGGTCLVLLVGITIAMVLFLVRYRRSRNPNPTQIEGNMVLEVTWIIIPTVIVTLMFFKGYKGFKLMRTVPEDAMVLSVEAKQWFWTFNYPEQDISSDKLYVPVDQPVKLELSAPEDDVVHSFYLPAFRVKEDCVPGKDTYMWFEAENTGTYNIFCAEYCGRDHSAMITELVVLSAEDYQAWLDEMVALKNKPIVIDVAMDPGSEDIISCDAPALFATYCASCHGKGGEGGLVEGARDFRQLDGWQQGYKVTDIYRTLEQGVEGTRMRSFTNLPAWDRFALAHHVSSFYTGTQREACTPEDIALLVEEYKLGEVVEPKATIPIEDAMRLMAEE